MKTFKEYLKENKSMSPIIFMHSVISLMALEYGYKEKNKSHLELTNYFKSNEMIWKQIEDSAKDGMSPKTFAKHIFKVIPYSVKEKIFKEPGEPQHELDFGE